MKARCSVCGTERVEGLHTGTSAEEGPGQGQGQVPLYPPGPRPPCRQRQGSVLPVCFQGEAACPLGAACSLHPRMFPMQVVGSDAPAVSLTLVLKLLSPPVAEPEPLISPSLA